MSLAEKLEWGALLVLAVILAAYYGPMVSADVSVPVLVNDFGPTAFICLLMLFAGRAFISLTSGLVEALVKPPELRSSAKGLWSWVVWAAVGIGIVTVLVGQASLILITVGFGVIAFAIAFTNPLLCVAAWFYVTFRRPFSVGDFVTVGADGGEVAGISLLSTTVWRFSPGDAGETGFFQDLPNAFVFLTPYSVLRKGEQHVWDEVSLSLPLYVNTSKARDAMLKACDEVIGAKKMSGNATELRARLEYLGIGAGVPAAPEVFLAIEGDKAVLRVRYMVDATQRSEAKSMISVRILSLLSGRK
jgi:small-conductance mechanosensitive channel